MIFKSGGTINIGWVGSQHLRTGYGTSAARILEALKGQKVQVLTGDDVEKCQAGIIYSPVDGDTLDRLPTPHKIVYTMFEADAWPEHWVELLNCANEVWVPSKWCAETLAASGCDQPIQVVPLGAVVPTTVRTKSTKGTFRIGYTGAASPRKGFDLLVEAFCQEFTEADDVELVILSSNMLSAQTPTHPKIRTKIDTFSDLELRTFYQMIDLFVMPSRGEGFGLTPLEAMANGTCVAVPNWGGMTEYFDIEAMLGISVHDLTSCNGYFGSQGSWARPSLGSIRYAMRYAYENREEVHQMGLVARRMVAERFTYEHTAARIRSLLELTKPGKPIAHESYRVVVWKGDPRKVTTHAGGFTRGIPRQLTDEQIARLNPSDVGPSGFSIEKRYRRI